MFRKIAATVVASLAALGIAAAMPGTASADPDQFCTSTAPINTPKIQVTPTGIIVVGWYRASFVASTPGLLETLKVWQVNFDPNGPGATVYDSAFAAKCASDGTKNGQVDLTKDAADTITSTFDQRCHNTDFANGSTSYHHIGLRTIGGNWFHYWGTTFSGTGFFGRGVISARCSFAP